MAVISGSADPAQPSTPTGASAGTTPAAPTRLGRIRKAAASRGIPLAAIVTAVALVALTFLAGKLLYRLRDVILLMVVGGFLALILNPLVLYLQHHRIKRRGWAVAIVAIWAALVFAGLAVAFGHPLVNGLTHLSQRLPSYVQDAEHGRGWIGHLARRYHLAEWAQRNAPKLQSIGASLAKPALSLGKGAVSLVVTLGTIAVLVLLLLLEGPKMRQGILGLMAPERAKRYARVAHEINQSVTGYMAGDVLTSVIAGVVVFFTLLALGVPFPLLWALWVALVDFLPQVGGALAGIPTVLFALGHSLTAGIITAAVFIAYQQIENHVLNPVIMSRTVKVNPLLILVSVLVGASIGDWVGGFFGSFVAALISIPAAGALQIVVKEVWQATGPGGPLDDEPEPARGEPASQATGKRAARAHRRASGPRQEAAPS